MAMNRREFLGLMAFVAVNAAGCGGGTQSSQSGSTPPAPGANEILKLITSRQLADKRWQYDLAVDLKAITGDKSALFVRHNEAIVTRPWVEFSVSDNGTGWANFQISSYDRLVKLLYGGSRAADSWASITGSAFYQPAPVDALYFGLENGMLLQSNDFAQGNFGSTATDSEAVVGFTLRADRNELDIYCNLNRVVGSLANPFWFCDQTGYTKRPIVIQDSKGWALKTVTIADGQTIKFTYGGDIADETSWAKITTSNFYNLGADFIVIGRQGSTILAR